MASRSEDRLVARLWHAFDRADFLCALLVYLLTWPLLEFLFVFRVRRYLRIRGAQRLIHHESDTREALCFWAHMLEEEPTETRPILRGWFVGDGALHKGNLLDLICWTLYAEDVAAVRGARRAQADRVLRSCEEALGEYPAGHNRELRCMRHTIEPLARCWKPLSFYLGVRGLRTLGEAVLRRRGFELATRSGRKRPEYRYWHHPGDGAAGTMPIVLLHGVGGLAPWYVPLLLQLRSARPSAPLFAPLLSHCSLEAPHSIA
jgi:hypothetical protein